MKLTAEQIAERIEATRIRVEAANRIKDEERNVFEKQAREAVSVALRNKLRFAHIRTGNGSGAKGGVTVVYHKPRHSSMITFSAAQCSPKDVYCRAKGRVVAMDNWIDGRRISLLLPKGEKPSGFFRNWVFAHV